MYILTHKELATLGGKVMIDKIMGIFDYRRSFFEFLKKMIWVFFVNIIFIVTSLPVITIGASATAMYTILQKLIQEREFSLFKDYFSSFKRNFVRSTVYWIICLVLGVICYLDIMFFVNVGKIYGAIGYALLAVAGLITIVFLMFMLAVFPIIAEFEGNFKDTFSIIKIVIMDHTVKSFMGVVSTVIIIGFAAYIILYAEYIFLYFPLIAIGAAALVLTYIYDSILRPYYEEDEELKEQ